MAIRISTALLAAIRAQAAASPDREVCGLLFGTGEAILDVVPADNVSGHPADSFELDPIALLAAARTERAGGRCILGHYHSHPGGIAHPSPRDAAAAGEPGRIWLILGRDGATAWRDRPGGPVENAFERVDLVVD